ncbi:endonuclease/exonuclease/phosphatase family protein [Puniceicoccaceae bacterium K14]|nr:endonuclease/exonuclease/phosphatase family protein [Puniceicoccaceae bacterium K14]
MLDLENVGAVKAHLSRRWSLWWRLKLSVGFRFYWLIALFAFSGGSLFADEPQSEWSVATYNVRNYLSQNRLVRGKWKEDYPKPEEEKQVVREIILEARPDFLALQEIGSDGHLRELQADLAKEGLHYKNRAILEASDPTRRVAALWNSENRYRVHEHDDLEVKYFGEREGVKRGLLEIEFFDKSGAFSIFILHLKSKYTTREDDPLSAKRRVLEARAVRDRILERYPDPHTARFFVVGDFNDTPDSAAIRAFEKRGKRKICNRIPALDVSGTIWTHFYRKGGLYSCVDYLMRSEGWVGLENAEARILSHPNFYVGSDHRLLLVEVPYLK